MRVLLSFLLLACAAPRRSVSLPNDIDAPPLSAATEAGASAGASCGTPVACGPLAAFGQNWQTADWAEATAGSHAELVELNGSTGLRFAARFTGQAYAQGVVSQTLAASFAECGALAMQIGLPKNAPSTLTAKVILFLDDKWVEGEDTTPLVAGQFVEVIMPLGGASASLPARADYGKATGFGVKIEGRETTYAGNVFVARVGLKTVAGFDNAAVRAVGTFGGFTRASGPDIPARNGFLTFDADKAVSDHALIWPKLGPAGADFTLARVRFGGHGDAGQWDFRDWVTLRATNNGVDAILSRAFPAVRYHSANSAFSLDTAFEGRDAMASAYWVSSGQVQRSSSDVDLSTMSEPWVVLSAGGAAGWGFDAPILVTFERKPAVLGFTGGGASFEFNDSVGRINVMPLFGVQRSPHFDEQDIVLQARAWVARLAAFPVSLEESFQVGTDAVTITDRYSYDVYQDEWGTPSERIAPLPPLVAQARDRGYPVDAGFERTGVRTWYGPFVFVAGDSATYSLPLPAGLDHLELPVRVTGDGSVTEIRREYDRLVRESMPNGPADFYLDGDDRAASVLCEAGATHDVGSVESMKAASVGPKLIEHGWLQSSLQWLTEPVSGQRYLNNAKYWASQEPFDKEWYTGRQLAALGVCAETQDLAIAAAVWPKALGMYRYDRIFFDWALGSALSSVYGYTALIDGIYFAWEGMQAVARLAKKLGDDATYNDAAYRAARQQVAVFMLWHQAKWVRDIDYGVGHITNAKLAPQDIETRFAFDGYVEDYGGATLELQSLWQNVNSVAYDVLPQFAFYRDFGIAPALRTLLFDVTPVRHPAMFDGNVMDPVDSRYYGSLNTAFFMQAKAAAFHADPQPFFDVYRNSDGTLASKEWYSMRGAAAAGALMLGLERAKAPAVEFPIAGAKPTKLTYDTSAHAVQVEYVGVASAHATLKITPIDGAPILQGVDTCRGVTGVVTVSIP